MLHADMQIRGGELHFALFQTFLHEVEDTVAYLDCLLVVWKPPSSLQNNRGGHLVYLLVNATITWCNNEAHNYLLERDWSFDLLLCPTFWIALGTGLIIFKSNRLSACKRSLQADSDYVIDVMLGDCGKCTRKPYFVHRCFLVNLGCWDNYNIMHKRCMDGIIIFNTQIILA